MRTKALFPIANIVRILRDNYVPQSFLHLNDFAVAQDCDSDEIQCWGEDRCILLRYICDGEDDCDNGSDENKELCEVC